jgi:hypothetical protein
MYDTYRTNTIYFSYTNRHGMNDSYDLKSRVFACYDSEISSSQNKYVIPL